uniref:Arylsulfatase B-like n=1 Tax=Saccoglossus kowalevskii TaxID=10224 RepID=A0ABM0MH87_SACKO
EKKTRPEFTFSKYAFLFVFSLGIAVAMGMMMYMKKSNPPHIVFILADDLGWNDIGWNNPIIKTPVLDSLAREGVIFNQTYSQPVCTPTRAALMTGYYPFHIGMQQKIITFSQGSGLPLKLKLLPQKLKEVGYITHLVGKWHLGYCNWAYTPLQRGFDSAYGNLGGLLSHVTKMGRGMVGGDASWYGYDFRDNTGVVQDDGTYSTILLASRAVDIISKHYPAYPLFLYFSIDQPAKGYDVPSEYTALYENIENEQVRNYYAKISLMDDAIGNVTQALKSRGMWDKTLLVFISDNGAFYFTQGTNLPLRGAASTLYEGGTRVPAMAHGTMLTKTGICEQPIESYH